MMRRWLIAATAILVLTSCGGDGSTPSPTATAGPSSTPAPTPTPTATASAAAWTINYLHIFGTFDGAASQPSYRLLEASDGNFYGTTLSGGRGDCGAFRNNPCGTAYQMTPAGQVTLIHRFGSVKDDGYTPTGGLIQGSDGLLYGVAGSGGKAGGGGVVYRMALDGSSYKILHHFGVAAGDGYSPHGELAEASDGFFYGTAANGGTNVCPQIPTATPNCGTVFKIAPDGTYQSLYAFGQFAGDGVQPNGTLLLAKDGNFYGTTSMGGANTCGPPNNCGAFFRMTPAGAVTILYSFGASLQFPIAPSGGLIQARDGFIYGTSLSGGGGSCGWSYGCGTVFRLSTSGAFAKIYSFAMSGYQDGHGPQPLFEGRDGALYGVTISGGEKGNSSVGTAFRLTLDGRKTTLYSFGPILELPYEPLGPLIQGSDGAFYGVTRNNGQLGSMGAYAGGGTFFRLTPP